MEQVKSVSEVLIPIQHERRIQNLLANIEASHSPITQEKLWTKVEWHTDQYLMKTGELPE